MNDISAADYHAVVTGLKIQHRIELQMMQEALKSSVEEFRNQVATLERDKAILTKQIYDINNKRNTAGTKTPKHRNKRG